MTKANTVWAMLIMLAGGGLYAGLWSAGHNWGGDFAAYIMQAISIVDGTADEFVTRNAFTINQSSNPMGPVAYPWGFPLLLAPVYSVFGMSLIAFKAVGLFFYLLFLLALWFGFRPLLKPVESLVFVALFAFNPAMLLFGDNILSDIPFLFFSTLSIALLNRQHHPSSFGGQIALGAVLGGAIGAAFLVRTNGVLLVLVYVGMLGIRAWQSRRVLAVGPRISSPKLVSLLLPLVVFSMTIGMPLICLPDGQSSHLGHLGRISRWFLFHNTIYYAQILKEFFAPAPGATTLGVALYLLSIPLVFAGIRKVWRESLPMILYSVLTIGLYIAWPYQEGLRFVFSLVPIYVYFLILGFRFLGQTLSGSGEFYILPLAGLALTFAVSSTTVACKNLSQGRPVPPGPYTEHAIEMFEFIEQNTSFNDIVIFRKPRVLRLFTGRPSLRIVQVGELERGTVLVFDRTQQHAQLSKSEIDALLLDKMIELTFLNAGFEVYRLQRVGRDSP